MHATFSSADEAGVRDYGGPLNTRSHGESFLCYLSGRPVEIGLWVLDEPEAALSFQSCLALLALLRDLAGEGSQVLLATHSPLLAACPGATVLELGPHGIHRTRWDELDMVRSWQAFLEAPERFFRHL
ncbi:MAG: AAA family ATPase [Pseudonocardiaceae bacterium]